MSCRNRGHLLYDLMDILVNKDPPFVVSSGPFVFDIRPLGVLQTLHIYEKFTYRVVIID